MPIISFPQRHTSRKADQIKPHRESRIHRKSRIRGPSRDLRGLAVVIGPVDVDLMGMTVSVPALTIQPVATMRPSLRSLPEAPRPGRQLHMVCRAR
jgi:hypothetical protein